MAAPRGVRLLSCCCRERVRILFLQVAQPLSVGILSLSDCSPELWKRGLPGSDLDRGSLSHAPSFCFSFLPFLEPPVPVRLVAI